MSIPRRVLPLLELEIAKKISEMVPFGHVRDLGSEWTPPRDRDIALEHFAAYVLSSAKDDDEMLALDTLPRSLERKRKS